MRSIFNKLLYEQLDNHDTVFAVITRDNGSAPRGKGAMMLVSHFGIQVGSIGGGAVEKKGEEIALDIIQNTKKSVLHDFTLRPNAGEDIGMVCGGDVTVYFQYIAAGDQNWNNLAKLVIEKAEKHEKSSVILYTDGSGAALIGADGELIFETGPSVYRPELSGSDGVLVMPVPVGERVLLFGAGHVAKALTPILASVGFRVTVFDCRPEFARAEYFPEAERLIVGDYTRISDYLTVGPDDYIVVMTHGHSFDYQIQEQLLRGDFAYFGVIGSAKKTASVNAKLHDAGVSPEKTSMVYTPIGLKIKAVTPEEIAVSISAEMILVRARRRIE